MKPDLAKVRARLDALRRMTTANGCTEAEALVAAEKAAELLAAHNVTETEADARLMTDLEVGIGTRRSPVDTIWSAVGMFADCRGWLARRGTRWVYVYFGNHSDVLVAEYVHEVIRRAADTALRTFRKTDAYQRRRTSKTRAHAQKAFLEGFAVSMREKLVGGLWKRKEWSRSGDPKAIIAVAFAPIDAELERRGYGFSPVRKLQSAEGRFRDTARIVGFVAGRAVNVDAPVAGATAAPQLLTTGDRS